MEQPDRLQNLENVVRELQLTAAITQHVLLATLEALKTTSPATLADLHDNLGGFINAMRVSGMNPAAPEPERFLNGLENIRSTLGSLLRQ